MFSNYISKQVATYLNTKREKKEEEKSLKKKQHFPQSYMNMSQGLRIDIVVKFNYYKDIGSSFQGVSEKGCNKKL